MYNSNIRSCNSLLYQFSKGTYIYTCKQWGIIKSEQIQPLFGTVKVSGDCDTDVVFTDIETGERYVVGYITSGVSEKIKLEKGKWYTVAGGGNLVIGPVNVRIE